MPKKKNSRQKHQKDASFAETSDEEQSQASPQNLGKPCPHLSRGINFGRIKKNMKSISNVTICSGCETAEPQNELEVWFCLQCGYRGCGRTSNNKHGLQHYKTIHSDCHALVLSTSSGIVWCYDCDNDVQLQWSSNLKQCVEFIMKSKSSNKYEAEKTAQTSKVDLKSELDDKNSEVSSKIENEDVKNPKIKNASAMKKEVNVQKRSVKGLRNLGNTCFFNAVMQNLCQTSLLFCELEQSCSPDYRWDVPKLICTDDDEVVEDEESSLMKLSLPRQFSLVNSLSNFLKQMNDPLSSKADIVNPSSLFGEVSKKAPQFSHFQQQDSHELLRQLLEGVRQEEIKRQKKAILRIFHLENVHPEDVDDSTKKLFKEYGWYAGHTLVERIFGGLLVSTVLCEECNAASQVVEPFMDLSLPLFEEKQQDCSDQQCSLIDGKKREAVKPMRTRKLEPVGGENDFGEYALIKQRNDPVKLSKHQEKKMKQLAKKEKKKTHNASSRKVFNSELSLNSDAKKTLEESISNVGFTFEYNEKSNETNTDDDKELEISPAEEDAITDSSLKETDEDLLVNNVPRFNNEEKKLIVDEDNDEQSHVSDLIIEKNKNMAMSEKFNCKNGKVTFDETNADYPEKANEEISEKACFEEVREDDDDAKCMQGEFLEKADDESSEKNNNVQLVNGKENNGDIKELCLSFQKLIKDKDSEQNNCLENSSVLPIFVNQIESIDSSDKECNFRDLNSDSPKDLCNGSSSKVIDVCVENKISEESVNLNACSTLDERMHILSMQAKEVRIRRDSDRQKNILNSSQNNENSELITDNGLSKTVVNGDDNENAEDWSHAFTENQSKEWLLKSLSTLKPRNHISPNECSVQSCLNHFTKPELLTGSNKFRCENCTKKKHLKSGNIKEAVYSNASKQLLIFSPPAILTLHLKRFQQCGMSLRKNNKFVEFPLVLNLAPFCSSACLILPHMASVTDEILYSLYGLVEHSGRLTSGHYTAYVKVTQRTGKSTTKIFENQWPLAQCDFRLLLQKFSQRKTVSSNTSESMDSCDNYRWYYISDSHVKEVTEATVLNSQAYLLFYERIK